MKISQILLQTKTIFQTSANIESIRVSSIETDSRKCQKNSIFFALKNGEHFIADALKNGASCVIIDDKSSFFELKNSPDKFCTIKVLNIFQVLIDFLKLFYSPLPTNIYAITGTNGKTSTAEFTRQILEIIGKKSASIGTIGVVCNHKIKGLQDFSLTTPDIVSLYKNLQILQKNGVENVAIEVSSIGLQQSRVAGLKIGVGAFTNFTQDHLDYHQSMDEYFRCKMILFESVLPSGSCAVLNSDIEEFAQIKKICEEKKHKIIEYGYKAHDLRLQKIEPCDLGQKVFFEFSQKEYCFELSSNGEFQALNALCALGSVLAKNNLSPDEMQNLFKNFHQLQSAPGRMQLVARLENQARVFIDFAHSSDALKNVLTLARKITKARVLVLFGCGGNRDVKKRPLMGKIACELADLVIVSDDNPRQENAAEIRAQILQNCDMSKTIEIAGRELAIKKAIELLESQDICILAGKGHEKYQIIGEEKFEFDEEKIVKNVVAKTS
jgi:UDP-N-acetylmuramoyl-L-alanyl-D-glutamate--2,6-diaminopimelate ligase